MMPIEKLVNLLKQLGIDNDQYSYEIKFSSNISKTLDELPIHITINGYGELNLPVNLDDLDILSEQAFLAKFGKRDKTLMDKNIRDTWEIPASEVNVNYGTSSQFLEIIEQIKNELGLPQECELTAHLHNLLIYKQGQFFAPHQDTEKLDGMVATLVVILPSPHMGGNLVIDLQGEKKTYSFANILSKDINFVAFYADCHHEVKPIKEGARVVLTYNLVANQVNDNQTVNIPPQLEKVITDYFVTQDTDSNSSMSPLKLAYLLDHSYTQHGLSWNLLKGNDRNRANALGAVAKKLGLDIYLALAEVREIWSCDGYNNKNPKPEELIDEEIRFSHWIDLDSKLSKVGNLDISRNELCWTKASQELEPFESEYEGYMGNYGDTIDYWYRRVAVVMWRKTDQLAIDFAIDPDTTFESLYNATQFPNNQANLCNKLHSLAAYLPRYLRNKNDNTEFLTKLLTIAYYVEDFSLAYSLLHHNDISLVSLTTVPLLAKFTHKYGLNFMMLLLQVWQDNAGTIKLYHNFVMVMQRLLQKQVNKDIIYCIAKHQYNVVYAMDQHDINRIDLNLQKMSKVRITRIVEFLSAIQILNDHHTHIAVINYIMRYPQLYPHLELLTLLEQIENVSNSGLFGFERLRQYIMIELSIELAKGLRSEDDWSILLSKSVCKCADCTTLNLFLISSTEKEKVWPMAEQRRNHITGIIRNLELPISFDTIRKGSPYTLLLTKKDSIYNDAKKRFEQVATGCNRFLIAKVA